MDVSLSGLAGDCVHGNVWFGCRAKKILNLRLFENPKNGDKPWDSSIKDLDLEVLCVSQVGVK